MYDSIHSTVYAWQYVLCTYCHVLIAVSQTWTHSWKCLLLHFASVYWVKDLHTCVCELLHANVSMCVCVCVCVCESVCVCVCVWCVYALVKHVYSIIIIIYNLIRKQMSMSLWQQVSSYWHPWNACYRYPYLTCIVTDNRYFTDSY